MGRITSSSVVAAGGRGSAHLNAHTGYVVLVVVRRRCHEARTFARASRRRVASLLYGPGPV